MYFGLSEDQIFFQDNVKKFLEDNAPLDVIRKITNEDDKTSKEDLHKGIITLGINNILIPEENGGLGLDLLFATAVSQSLGEGVATLPFIGSYVMAPISIKYGANDSQQKFYFDETKYDTYLEQVRGLIILKLINQEMIKRINRSENYIYSNF